MLARDVVHHDRETLLNGVGFDVAAEADEAIGQGGGIAGEDGAFRALIDRWFYNLEEEAMAQPGAAEAEFGYHQDIRFRRPRTAYRDPAGSYVQMGIAVDPRADGRMSIRAGFSMAYQPHHGQSISGARALPPQTTATW